MPSKVKYRCDNCGFTTTDEGKIIPLAQVHHLWERIEGGSEVPAGECPKKDCGALMFEVYETLVLTGPGGDLHGVVRVSGVTQKEIEAAAEEAGEKYNQNLSTANVNLYVTGPDELRKWLKSKNGGRS